ncbi:MAG: DUF6775 family putative metallopeptidase [Dehalococcoidia bacterium]|nr:hypothetical protein [Chloroflexota bacterium]MBT9161646.1 hypothetical protein [Chloroflexota bacterium]
MKAVRVEAILLYDEGTAEQLNIEEIAKYLIDKLKRVPVEVRGNPFASCREKDSDWARKLASIKIQNAARKLVISEPLYGEVQYEQRRILGKTRAFGVLYDGFHLLRIFSELIPRGERAPGFVHIFLTNRLFATWDDGDRRYHARTSVYGLSSVISTTGIVEAPAKPREYYVLKQQYEMLGKDLLELKERFKGSFIDYEDERLTEVVKGYAMQAVFYSSTGDPFCDDKGCRLYNAHWQEELIFAQLESEYEFCPRHTGLLNLMQTSRPDPKNARRKLDIDNTIW